MTSSPTNLTLDTTLSGEFSNSYCDLTFANQYFANHYDSTKTAAWQALSPMQQTMLLISACRVIETARFTNYIRPTDYAFFYDYITGMVRQLAERMEPIRLQNIQQLQFPRNMDIDLQTGQGFIPGPILMAQCEQAIYLLSYDGQAVANRLQGIIIDRVSLGRGQVNASQQYLTEGTAFAPMALEFCRPYFLKGGARVRRA